MLIERCRAEPVSGSKGDPALSVLPIEGAEQHAGIEDSLDASAVSPVNGKAPDPGKIASDRASRSAAICDRGVTGCWGDGIFGAFFEGKF